LAVSWGRRKTGGDAKKEVDGAGDKPHNLTSSLLMNTTLHHQAAGSTEQVL
jgi:hypothetical protein